jgi:IS5 family transposase
LFIKGFLGNPFDGHTIDPLLQQMKTNKIPFPKNLPVTEAAKENRKLKA